MGVASWIVFGLIAGILAKWLMPGDDGGGIILTCVLGIVGAFVGGYVGTLLDFGTVGGFDLRSLGIAILGAMIVLFGYRALAGKK
jgi:uncharacterized membrane protein YeaQ/YmgE (transglycosylase-associated protein family)